VVIAGHALVQNVRRGHYELGVEEPVHRRVAVAFEELVLAIRHGRLTGLQHAANPPDATALAGRPSGV